MSRGTSRRGAWLLAGGLALVLLLGGAAGAVRGFSQRTHHGLLRELAWRLGAPELAYNWDVAVPGRIYRSGLPDPRFVEHVRERYGVERVVSLTGEFDAHERARQLGMEVSVFHWPASRLAPTDELEQVLALLEGDERVWVHCHGGSDRTGYAVASHRVRGQGWDLERAVEEMRVYAHDPESKPELHESLRAFLGRPTSGAGS